MVYVKSRGGDGDGGGSSVVSAFGMLRHPPRMDTATANSRLEVERNVTQNKNEDASGGDHIERREKDD